MSEDENADLVRLLGKCTPGSLSPEVFESVARVTVYPAIELVPYRYLDGSLQVGLLRRPEDDNFWPSMWHIPGTVLRPTDRDLGDAFTRLSRDEFVQPEDVKPAFISVNIVPYIRGSGLTIEHSIDLTGVMHTEGLTFFDVRKLPNDFIDEQRPIIERFLKSLSTYPE